MALSSCTPGGGPTPRGNGEGITGAERPILNFENGRIRCDFTRDNSTNFEVNCNAVVMQRKGNEVLAEEILAGVALAWQPPQQLEGELIESISCVVAESKLSQRCDVRLRENTEANIEFSLDIRVPAEQKQKIESAIVRLPYSVQSFGRIPQLTSHEPRSVGQGATTTNGLERGIVGPTGPEVLVVHPLGVQSPPINPMNAPLVAPSSLCVNKGRLYFSSSNYIYVLERGVVRLYAGSGNFANREELSHRLRVSFVNNDLTGANVINLACSDTGLYVSISGQERVLRIQDEGPVEVIAKGSTPIELAGGQVSGQMGAPYAVAVGADETVYIVVRRKLLRRQGNKLKYLGGNGDLRAAMLSNFDDGGSGLASQAFIDLPTGLAVDSEGSLYVAEGRTNRILKFTTDGNFSTVIGKDYFNPLNENYLLHQIGGIALSKQNVLHFSKLLSTQIFKRNTDGSISVVAGALGSPISESDCDGSPNSVEPALETSFGRGPKITFSDSDEIYFTDNMHCRLGKITSDQMVHPILRTTVVPSTDQSPSTNPRSAMFPNIEQLLMAPDGTLYFTDSDQAGIGRISADGKQVNRIPLLPASPDGPTLASWIAMSPEGELYALADKVVYRLNPSLDLFERSSNLSGLNPDRLFVGRENQLFVRSWSLFTGIYPASLGVDVTPSDTVTPLIGVDDPNPDTVVNELEVLEGALANQTQLETTVLTLGPTEDLYFSGFGASLRGNITRITKLDGTGVVQHLQLQGDDLPATISFLTTDAMGNIYAIDQNKFKIYVAKPIEDGAPSTYQVKVLVGNDPGKDCTGSISHAATSANVDEAVKQTLSTLCVAKIVALTVQNNCSQPDGKLEFAFAQRFDSWSNIVKVSRPCSSR